MDDGGWRMEDGCLNFCKVCSLIYLLIKKKLCSLLNYTPRGIIRFLNIKGYFIFQTFQNMSTCVSYFMNFLLHEFSSLACI